tara:strand:+ start:1909 stop:4140 length:2232 start_codon:yes stop_codon:yes gene_type:complete
MNIIDVQDKLKDFSEQQLVREMQMPSGTAPQFLVLSEIQRRKRMRDDFAKREAAQQQTVAQEAVSAAGVPNSGIAGMSEAMAPKSTMAQNAVGSNMAQAMRSGGLAQFGQELSGKVSEGVEPFLDEVEGMAQERFGVDISGPSQTGLPEIAKIQPMYEIARPNPDMFLGRVPAFMQPGYRGPRPRIANRMMSSRGGKGGSRDLPYAFNEGGAVKMSRGGLFDAQGRPTEALLRALIAQESGGDPMARGSLDEVGISQIRPSTALMPGYGVTSMFPEIAANIGEGREYATAAEAYQANKDLIDAGLEDPERSTAFTSDYLTAMRSRFDDDDRALAAYNVGPGGAAKLEDPSQFGYVADVRSRLGDEPSMLAQAKDAVSSGLSALNPISTAQAQTTSTTPAPAPEAEAPKTLNPDRKTMILGTIEMNKGNPGLLASQARGFLEDPLVASDPEIIAALRAAGINPASTARVVTEPITVEKDTTLPSGEVVEAGDQIEVGDILDFQLAETIGALDDTEGTGTFVGASGQSGTLPPEAAESEDRVAAGEFVPMISAEGFDYNIPAGALSAEDDEAAPETETPEADDEKKDDGTKQPDSNVTLFGGEAAPQSSIEAEIAKLKGQLEKGRDTDKWLALAQAGMALMSSKEPTLLGAAGEAGISGLTAFREAQDRYQEGIVDLINAEAKLKDKKSTGITAASAVSRLNKIEELLNPTDATAMPLDPEVRTRLQEEARYLRRNILGYADITA